MTHVTVVQVHEPHLRQVQREGKTGAMKECRRICQEGSFAPREFVAEVLYVNVMELRQQISPEEGTPETRCPQGEAPSSGDALQFLPKPKNRKRPLSRKSSIMNQNVGVTGSVFMKSEPESEVGFIEDSESESESSLSGSDSGLSSTIEVGMSPTPKHSTTITIGDEVSSAPRSPGEDTVWIQNNVGEDTMWLQKTVGKERHCIQNTVGEETSCIQNNNDGEETYCIQNTVGKETHCIRNTVGEETHCIQYNVDKERHSIQNTVGEETSCIQNNTGEETYCVQNTVGEKTHCIRNTVGEDTHCIQYNVGKERHCIQNTFGEETSYIQNTVGEETYCIQKTVGEETYCIQNNTIGEETHCIHKVVCEDTPWLRNVGEETHYLQNTVGEETHIQNTVGEETHIQNTVGEETHHAQKALEKDTNCLQKPVGEETRLQEAGGEETPRHQNTIMNDSCSFQKGILLQVSPKPSSISDEDHPLTNPHPHDEIISIEYSNFEVSEDMSEAALTLEWRIIPPSHHALQQHAPLLEMEVDRASTPTSFSSAYTVTEHENESTSEESESSRNNWSGQESDEEHHSAEDKEPMLVEVRAVKTYEHNQLAASSISPKDESIFPTTSDCLVKEAVLSAVPSVLRRLRHPSEDNTSINNGEESIVYSYIPCRDQREKEDEELWVANEGITRAESVCSETSCSVDVRASPRLGSNMCTLAPTIAGDPRVVGVVMPAPPTRKHYSTRQRTSAETQIIKVKVVEDQRRNSSDDLPTSPLTRKPTKRFSFLVRSNSVKQDEALEVKGQEGLTGPTGQKQPAPTPQDIKKEAVTPSDQAILDKLASLNIETPAEVILRSKPRKSLYDPPCTRCGDPVYPQERIEPTLRLVFHISCFKCHHCGVRLTLKTFYRSPLDSRDARLFCRSHVPTLDPGKLDVGRSDSNASSGKSSPDCSRDSQSDIRGRSTSPSTCIQERLEIVKCDTIGLRYF
ncbi:uncharacterized protein [Palaemon carinicauda]|uniref:uncharacterized protein n=1 Tax=Palaemon carinicauda TaxID=392227 RepID=UPI0035B66F6A